MSMKIKLADKTMQYICIVQHSTTLLTQRNKCNFSTITSQVSTSPRWRHCRLRNPGQQGRSINEYKNSVAITTGQLLSSQQPNCCCHRNSHSNTTDGTDTTRLV